MKNLIFLPTILSLLFASPIAAQSLSGGLTRQDLFDYCQEQAPLLLDECSDDIILSWQIEQGYNFCDGQTAGLIEVLPECSPSKHQLVEVSYKGTYLEIINLLHQPEILKTILGNINPTENTIIQVLSKNSCSSIFIDGKTAKVSIPNRVKCRATRSAYVTTFPLIKNTNSISSVTAVQVALQRLPIIRDNAFFVNILNNNNYYFLLATREPQKNIILKKNYWEMVTILLLIDQQDNIAIASLDAKFATGLRPPDFPKGFADTTADYHSEVANFIRKLQDQINESNLPIITPS